MTTRLNMKKAVPRWETCPTKARAINPLETVPTKRLERHAQVVVFRRHDRDQLRGKLQARVFGRVLFHLSLLLSSDELVPFIEEERSPGCSWRGSPTSFEPFLSFYLTLHAEPAYQNRFLPICPMAHGSA